MKVCIILSGCDDTTYINDVEVTEDQLLLLEAIAKMSLEKSQYACMPTMHIDRENKEPPYY